MTVGDKGAARDFRAVRVFFRAVLRSSFGGRFEGMALGPAAGRGSARGLDCAALGCGGTVVEARFV